MLYQGESFSIRNPSNAPIAALVLNGSVTVTYNRIVITKLAVGQGQDNLISFTGSVPETIGNSGLSAIASAGDQVLTVTNSENGINKGYSTIIQFNGTNWIDTDTFANVTNTFQFLPGVGYTYRRVASAPVGDVIWSNQPDYIPSL